MNPSTSNHAALKLAQAVERAYQGGQTDYAMPPLVLVGADGLPAGAIQDGDAVIFCCRRGEREIELTEAFTQPDFSHFERRPLQDLDFVILTLYHEKFKHLPVAFAPARVSQTLGEVISLAGLRQLRCSESEKFAHVTFFLSGGNNQSFPGEDDLRIPSPKNIPFDQVPELSLPQVADKVIQALQKGYDLIVTNFANGDVIGHTSNEQAKLSCARFVDFHLGRVVEAAKQAGYVVAITADHGNLEVMRTEDGKPHVAHTSNLVPFILIDPLRSTPIPLKDGSLPDIAPTLLNILGLPIPDNMTGHNLAEATSWTEGRQVLLIILDGWGIGEPDASNPIYMAETPVWDKLLQDYPHAQLHASGPAVGLQQGKPGNSEAGHMNIGAGRVVPQDDVRLDQAMADGSFYTNEVFLHAIDGVKARKTRLHLIGLLTEKSSHGSIDYPLALLRMARDKGLQDVCLHIIFDGRSTPPGSAPALLQKLEQSMTEIGIGQVVSGVGRGIALDRDGNYAKIQKAYEAMVLGHGEVYR